VVSLNFADGGYVRQGQVIATMAHSEEQAQLAAATAQQREAGQQLERIRTLKERGFATNASLDAQVAAFGSARAAAAQAKAAIADRVIRAPFSGWVSLRNVSAGAVIPAGTEIATISDLSQIKLDFSIPETLLATVQEGQVIEAQAAAFPDHPVRGKVQTIDPVVNPATRAVTIRAILPNPDLRLKPGMLLTVQVEAGAHTALSVPELAVLGDGEDRFVYIVDDQGKAQRTEVRTGARQDGRIEIVDGLSRGQKVVTDGIVKLSDGLPVRVTKNAGAAGSKENMMAEPGG
jgi:membrane fusion protein (multidrug efflux system)